MTTQESFNPRVREGRDDGDGLGEVAEDVSIHASVKDATDSPAAFDASFIVSIHASVKDATGVAVSREPEPLVSIHASVKDATVVRKRVIPCRRFNPRVREGRD